MDILYEIHYYVLYVNYLGDLAVWYITNYPFVFWPLWAALIGGVLAVAVLVRKRRERWLLEPVERNPDRWSSADAARRAGLIVGRRIRRPK